MKTLKLNQIEKNRLSEKMMNQLVGGAVGCGCGCQYAGEGGGSSHADNGNANDKQNLHSPGMIQYQIYIENVGWRVYWDYPL